MLDLTSYHVLSTFSLHPFFISYATDKEMALCMCKICLNARLLDNVLMVQAKTDGDDSNNLIAHFLCTVVTAQSPLMSNDYYRWKDCKQFSKNEKKKHLEISPFYTSVPKIMIIGYTVPEIWHVMNVFIFHFGLHFSLLPL